MKKINILLWLALAFLPFALNAKTVVIYHTSDTHGFYYPDSKKVGGFAALQAVLKAETRPYIWLDSGDFSNGTAEAKNSKGLKSVQVLNRMNLTASTIGNHEFTFKDAGLMAMLKQIKFPVLACNLVEAGSGKLMAGVKPYQVFNVGGVRIAVVGLATNVGKTKQYTVVPGEEALREVLQQLKGVVPAANTKLDQLLSKAMSEKTNANVTVLLAHQSIDDKRHAGSDFMEQIPSLFPGQFDLILGGHAHSLVQNQKVNGTVFVESATATKGVSRIVLDVDDQTGKLNSLHSEYILLDENKVGADKETATFLETLREPGVDRVIGNAPFDMPMIPVVENHADMPFANWVADLLKHYSYADVFVLNNGLLRQPLVQGEVLYRDLLNICPNDNAVMVVEVRGAFFKRMIAAGLEPASLYTYGGVTFSYKEEGGKKIVFDIMVNGQPLDERRLYKLAMSGYIGEGNGEGAMFKEISNFSKIMPASNTLREFLEYGLAHYLPTQMPATGRILIVK